MATPTLVCPDCGRSLEYHVTIEMLNPPIGKIDTGYCVVCRRLFECIRETGTFYETSLWPPLCRTCRQPVTFAAVVTPEPEEETVLYHCQVHSSEHWVWNRPTERWTRRSE
jgi:hypothetical protein